MEGFSRTGEVLPVLHAPLSPFSPGKCEASNSRQLIRLDLKQQTKLTRFSHRRGNNEMRRGPRGTTQITPIVSSDRFSIGNH
jgi:hypothetical protein